MLSELYGQFFFYYVILVSLLGMAAVFYDKECAKRSKRRISEKNLFTLALLGAGAAMYVSMLLIRHKTRRKKFMLGFPLIILCHSAVVYLFIFLL